MIKFWSTLLDNKVDESKPAAAELAAIGKNEKTLSEMDDIIKPVKNQTWPSGIRQS